jgi:hypothetical protein
MLYFSQPVSQTKIENKREEEEEEEEKEAYLCNVFIGLILCVLFSLLNTY